MKYVSLQLTGCYGWVYTELPEEENGIPLKEEYKNQKLSDVNIGIDKANGKIFLNSLEYLTREGVSAELSLPLSIMPPRTPHHLDDRDDYIGYRRKCFERLVIRRTTEGSSIKEQEEELILSFDRLQIQEFFTRMYTNFEIYATYEDNVLKSQDQNSGEIRRVVVWGVKDGSPIYY